MKQHPLSAALTARTIEEIESIENCEGLVALTDLELDAITSSMWFKSMNESRRALLVVTACDWAAKGSNQHKRVTDPRSPRSAAKLAGQVIAGAANA